MRKTLAALLMVPALAFGQGFWNPGFQGGTIANPLALPDGTCAIPALKFASDSGMGWYKAANSQWVLCGAGASYFSFIANSSIRMGPNGGVSVSGVDANTAADVFLLRDAANTWAQRNGTNAQALSIYNTFTNSSNYERLNIQWLGNEAIIYTGQAGTGTARTLKLGTNNAGIWQIDSTGTFSSTGQFEMSAPRYNARVGNSPTMGACGTSPSITGKDSGFSVTVGTGGVATTCAINFSATWTTAPVCVAQNNTDRVSYSMVTTATVATITATAAITASSKFHVICIGQ